MTQRLSWLLSVLLLSVALPLQADSRPDHFQGKPADTLEMAVANLTEYNHKLAALLAQESLAPRDLHAVHQLTYTLENALEKIQAELVDLAEVLEEVHVASETADAQTVQTQGAAYLGKSAILLGTADR